MSQYDRMVGRSGGHTADGLGSTQPNVFCEFAVPLRC